MRPRMNASLLEPYKSNEKQNMTRPVRAIIIEFTEKAIRETGFTDRSVDRK
jgi:hypothetical protein